MMEKTLSEEDFKSRPDIFLKKYYNTRDKLGALKQGLLLPWLMGYKTFD